MLTREPLAAANMSIRVFLSTVTDEFRPYRDQLRADLTRHNVEVKTQEDFKDLGGDTLDKLDTYIGHCEAVVHLVGEMRGSIVDAREQAALLRKYPDMGEKLPSLGEALRAGAEISYTQWEAWLALYHNKLLLTAKAEPLAPRAEKYAPTDESRAAQTAHLARLEAVRRYPGCAFANAADLAKHIAYTAILDLLVEDYAKEAAKARDVAEGFIREMAGRVAEAKNLDFDGMKEAVRNAIDIYETEIAGKLTQTNLGDVVNRALAKAKQFTDEGKAKSAEAALYRAAETLQRDEDDRRAQYEAGIRALYGRARDTAFAVFDAEAAARAILAMAEKLSLRDTVKSREVVNSEAESAYEYGRDKGSNVHLVAAISLRRRLLEFAAESDEKGKCFHNLGIALVTLGERESGTARLDEAVSAYRAALTERTRDRVPFDWAATQNNLGNALRTLGERESGTARLDEAVSAFRAALTEYTRDRVPLDWAGTQNNLGNALLRLGERESGTARLEEAVSAYRAALTEYTQERVPLDWAMTQNNLGLALRTLGSRESGAARLEEAVSAYRAALTEYTRDRVPLGWAMTQNNLGAALRALGERESGTARLEDAVSAYRAALTEQTRDRVPLDWAMTQNNLGNALETLGERESGTDRLEEAVAAFREALTEFTQDRVPLQWATTQNNRGNALVRLGERESGTVRLEEAVSAFSAALTEWTRGRVPLLWATSTGNQGDAMRQIAERRGALDIATIALAQIESALAVMIEGGHAPSAAYYEAQAAQARAVVERLGGKA